MLKMSIFTTYFQKLIKHEFPLHILYELFMSLRRFRYLGYRVLEKT